MEIKSNGKMTITELAARIGVVSKTIIRWEKAGKITRAKKDWRGWRVYTNRDFQEIKRFHDSLY